MNDLSQLLDALQWPAMALTIMAAWLVASSHVGRRRWGFWIFLASNAVWIVWAVPANAPALVLLQVGLAAMNIRGARKTAQQDATQTPADRPVG